MKLILASASRDRKKCLERAQIPFDVITSNFDESQIIDSDPIRQVERIAIQKGKIVAERWQRDFFSKEGPAIIIAADTMVLYQNQLLGKAGSQKEAKKILQLLAGQTHIILTGVAVIHSETKMIRSHVDQVEVHLQSLTNEEIEAYITNSDEYQGRAGAYSLFDRASFFIDNIVGNPSSVIGLPMSWLYKTLREFGINTLTF